MNVDAISQRLRAFVAVWKDRPDGERSGFQHFLVELCQALGTATPDGVDFVFEYDLAEFGDRGRVDAFKRGHFMMEAKRARNSSRERGSTPVRGNALAYTAFIRSAYVNQLHRYRRALAEAPPLLIVVDIGHMIWIWPAFAAEVPDFWSPERITIPFAALPDPRNVELLLACFERPELLDRRRTRQRVSEAIARELSTLARALEQRHARAEVADFVMRLLFCLFADAAGLLPAGLMADLCETAQREPEGASLDFAELFATMRTGGRLRGRTLERFGPAVMGEQGRALPLRADELALLGRLCRLDWLHLDPAIFGTLLEQALDERERWSLGAHYTPRAYVERLVAATLEPLEQEWRAVQALFGLRCAALGESVGRARLRGLVRSTLAPFHERLLGLQILDPACGTGNFLTLAYQRVAAIDQEYRALVGQLFGDQQVIEESLAVVPDRFVGLEKSGWAAEIAQLVLFLGHAQIWLERTGLGPIGDHERGRRAKVIAALAGCRRSIRVGDAVLDAEGHAPTWPAADYIVGNPPYIGNKQMREALGHDYVERLRDAYPELPRSIDLVMYWWHLAARAVAERGCRRMGLITTNSIRQVQNRPVVRAALDGRPPLRIAWALPDHPWIDRGAQVRIAMLVVEQVAPDQAPARLGRVVGAVGDHGGVVEVAFESVERIHADLQAALELETAESLEANLGVCFQGMNLVGKDGFLLGREQVVALGYDPDALPSTIRPYLGGREFLHARPEQYVIDAWGLDEPTLEREHPRLHAWLRARVWPLRKDNARAPYRERWWVFGEPRGRLRAALVGRARYIVTNETARQRTFEFVDAATVPDHQLYAVASDDPFVLGVLLSLAHRCWALALGGRQGVGNDPRYNSTACFATFPFPDPPQPLRDAIAELAAAIDHERKQLRREDPQWTLAKIHARLDAMLREGTMIDLRWGTLLGRMIELDQRVGEAYGLEPRGDAWTLDNDGPYLLANLLRLNHERRREERARRVRWLRPDLVAPELRTAPIASQALDERRAGAGAADPSSATPREWPRDPLVRLQLLSGALARAARPMQVADLGGRFRGARPKTLARLLDVLATLGYAERVETGWRACR